MVEDLLILTTPTIEHYLGNMFRDSEKALGRRWKSDQGRPSNSFLLLTLAPTRPLKIGFRKRRLEPMEAFGNIEIENMQCSHSNDLPNYRHAHSIFANSSITSKLFRLPGTRNSRNQSPDLPETSDNQHFCTTPQSQRSDSHLHGAFGGGKRPVNYAQPPCIKTSNIQICKPFYLYDAPLAL